MPNEGSPTLDSPSTPSTSPSPPAQPNKKSSNSNGHTSHLHSEPLPQTPPPHAKRHPPHQQHSRSPSLPSPLSLSLHHLGIGTPSPLLRQFSTFSSPPTWGSPPLAGMGDPDKSHYALGLLSGEDDYPDEKELAPSPGLDFDADDDMTSDSKDVLVQRLGDLVKRLRGTERVDGLEELHGMVDAMEGVLGGGKRAKRPEMARAERGAEVISTLKGARVGGEEALPVQAVGETQTQGTSSSGRNGIQVDVTAEVVVEAERLNAELVKLAEKLTARKEESDHIQAMLVERAEAAAAHIIELEAQIAELEDEIGGNESDLRHLRIELRAVETLCHEFVPPEADPDLVQSIANWKTDWTTLKEKMSAKKKSRRQRYGGDGEGESTILSPSISSISMLGSPLK
ncbi:hypothetical protein QBC34DRAFT_391122 [Podospora aff. communis PSN243]|uniref:GDP/GTP exchange factor Sec2 N-terminal domain-containing protein n=1 Tax=Podospora aff. communis PSN243 TaxID=3040156 RepID=A0AAV9H1R1_9PEZI|nr:hypothetical protein QBC34DRAFT_391122 [Podospora aff. communis PSN243]